MNDRQFTTQQLADWQAYERVRKSGKYHMMSVQARQEMRLDQARCHFVQQHFAALRLAVEAAMKTEDEACRHEGFGPYGDGTTPGFFKVGQVKEEK